VYEVVTERGQEQVHVSDVQYSPFMTITSRPELAQSIPMDGAGQGFTYYTWYDHPFVLRVAFGRNVASLGSINSCATIAHPLPHDLDPSNERQLVPLRQAFAEGALEALNKLIAIVRRRARLYHVFDLRREDIDVTVRNDQGGMVVDDPLQAHLIQQEEAESERFDLVAMGGEWYDALREELTLDQPIGLATGLLIEAERSQVQRLPRQAIATCHTAIEAACSALLTRGMQRRGRPDYEIDELLATKSLTSKLDPLLHKYTGFGLKHDNYALWQAFNDLNDLRNDIVHRGRTPTADDAEGAIVTTRQLLAWLNMVRKRNR
jgi:hypothetical protein